MDQKQKYNKLLLPIVLIFSVGFCALISRPKEISATLLTTQKTFLAGNEIALDFKLNMPAQTQLFLHTSLGATSITSENGRFIVPEFISRKKGHVDFQLYHNSERIFQGKINIKARNKGIKEIETYIGPTSIIAGGKDFTMHIVIPTDAYDNPLPDSTTVQLKHQFLENEKEKTLYSKDMIGWSAVYSYAKSGRMLLSSKVDQTTSKEHSIDIFPSLPEKFEITSQREHPYADGNQITTFTTSILKDEYGNSISDGTLVTFLIKDEKGLILRANGSTIHGIATGKILHPDHQSTWEIQAFVPGVAESNTIRLAYTSVLNNFKVAFTNNYRKITVGPILSFMEQLIPNGAIVKLKIFQNHAVHETKVKTSLDGMVIFELEEGFYASGTYDFEIETMGVEKTYTNIKLQ